MKGKNITSLAMLIVSLLVLCSMSYALPVSDIEVKVDGDVVQESSFNYIYDFEKNQNVQVKVRVTADMDIDNVQIEASIRGYDHNDLMEDITDVFDMKNGTTYTKTLDIPFRLRMDQDRYKLRVRIEDRNGATSEKTYDLQIDTKRHSLAIKDVVLSPEDRIKAGRALLATVRVQNYGEKNEKGIKIKVSIPDLGLSASDFIDEIEKDGDDDDQATSEELYMKIPDCAEPGTYDVVVEVSYDDGDEKDTKTMTIKVVEGDICNKEDATETPKTEEKTILTIGPDKQSVAAGASAIYPITITNAGSSSKMYTISVDSASWGTFTVSPSNVVVLDSGESKAVYVYATPNKDASGEQMFAITVKSGDKTLKQVALKADITPAPASGMSKIKKALEIGLVILVVLLVILGLIIGFNKLKGSDEGETKEESSTYY